MGKIIANNKILIVTSGIKGPTLMGGIATAFYNLAFLLSKNGFDVSILYAAHPYYGSKEKSPEYWKKEFKKHNIKFIPLESKNEYYGHPMMKRSYSIYCQIKESKEEYSKIIFHDFSGIGFYTFLAKRTLNYFKQTTLIVSCHGNNRLSDFFNGRTIDSHNKLMEYYLEKKSIEYADQTTTPSKYYENWFKEKGYILNNNTVIQNIIHDDSIIYKTNNLENVKKNILHFCFFGRIEPLKGIFLLLNAIRYIKEYHEDDLKRINLTFIGNSTEINGKNSIKLLQSEFDSINFKINFKTNLNTEQAIKFIRETNGIIVNPTRGETSSYTVMESILNGIPFIASDIPAIKELIPKKYHSVCLFKNNDSKSLAEKILQYLSHQILLPQLSIPKKTTESIWIDVLNKTPEESIEIINYNEIKVSIIIPTNNRISIFEDTLKSILNQSYKKIEILIGNDNSIKDRKELDSMVISLSKRYDTKISIYNYEGSGKAYICNDLSKKASGDYLLFFDDDDIALPHMINTYVKSLAITNGKFYTDITQCFEETKDGEKVSWNKNKIKFKHISLGVGDASSVNAFINYFGKPNFFIEKQTYINMGGMTEDYKHTPYIDWDLFIKASVRNIDIILVPEILYLYRLNSPNSIYYSSHNSENNTAITKRILGHKKVAENLSLAFPEKWRDYIVYSHLQLSFPKIDEKKDNSKDLDFTNKKKLEQKNRELKWYADTYDHLPKWYLKIGGIFRRIKVKKNV